MFLENCPPTPPLGQHFAVSEKQVLMLAYGRGRWAVSQKSDFSMGGGGLGDTVLHPGYVPDWQVDIHAVFY